MWLSQKGEKTRFLIVGGFGAFLAWAFYTLIHYFIPFESRAIIAWVISYIVAVAQQHSLHRRFTFFSNEEPFLPELLRAYAAYSLGLVVSTASHAYLTSNLHLYHQISWVISTGISVICNFVMLKSFVFHKES